MSVLREVYYALVNSYVQYGILIWGNASQATLQPLNVLLNKAVRIITFAPFGPLDLEPIYRDLELLNLNQTVLLERAKFMFKRKNNLLPTTIANFFATESRPESRYNLRRTPNNGLCFRSNLEVGKKSIQNIGEILWSELPPYLKDSESLKMFKKYYKSHLIGTDS